MVKMKHICLLALSLVTLLQAGFDVDHAVFRGDETVDVLEVYLLIPRNNFKFIPDEEAFRSNILIRVALAQNDTVVDWKQWTLVDRLADTTKNISSQQIPEIVTFQAAPGMYKLILLVADQNTGNKDKQEVSLELPVFSSQDLSISDIHLASNMKPTTQQNKYSKYFGYDMIPHASLIYGVEVPTVYTFCEVYNLGFNAAKPGNYQVEYKITDINGNTMRSVPLRDKIKPGSSSVEVNNISVGDLKGGLYDFVVTIKDPAANAEISKTKRFYIVKGADEDIFKDIVTDNYLADMSEAELDKIFGPMQYFATNTEKKQYKQSDKAGKRQIIMNFWASRDSDPGTRINEAQQIFETRVAYSNQQYGNMRTEGWKTDRGRVCIVYGYPSDIERHPNSLGTRPYEVWYYHDIEGGIEFVFVDKTGFGILELVHSTARNELQDDDWERWIQEGASGTSTTSY